MVPAVGRRIKFHQSAVRALELHNEQEPAGVQDLREKIDQHYRVRLILDNLPITTYDLEENPESIRPGYEIGFAVDGKYYLNNHLMFKILVHKTNGQYSKARQDMAELEAAAVVEVGIFSVLLASASWLLGRLS